MKQCPFCAGVIPDGSTICKHCKQAIPSARARGNRAVSAWVALGVGGVLVALGAPALFWLRPNDPAGAKTEEGRRAQVVEGLQLAEKVSNDQAACGSPTAVAEAWRKTKVARRDDPEWEHAKQMAEKLEVCRGAIAKALSDSIGELRHKQRAEHAETVRRYLQTQGFDTTVALQGADKDEVLITSPQLTPALLDRVTAGMSVQSGSFLENWQKLGCLKVTFTDGKRRWAYDLPKLEEAFQDVSVLSGMGLGAPLTLQ
jgi:hypothetical protein